MEKPMQFTIVKDVPLDSSGAFCATKVENKGESAITTNPQKKRNKISSVTELLNNNNGEAKQHRKESKSEMVASFFTLKVCESRPLITQASPPEAMIRNDSNGTFI